MLGGCGGRWAGALGRLVGHVDGRHGSAVSGAEGVAAETGVFELMDVCDVTGSGTIEPTGFLVR